MKHIIDAIAAIIVVTMALFILLEMLRPFVPYMLAAIILLVVGNAWYRRSRTW